MAHNDTAAFDVEIVSRVQLAPRVARFDFRRSDGEPFTSWRPGAHVDLLIDESVVRQYSICGEPDQLDVLSIAVLRVEDGRGGSRTVHDRLPVGSRVQMRGPRNNFELDEARRYEFIAGGIGITPLLPMIRQAARSGADWHLTYGARTLQDMAFRDELEAAFPERTAFVPEEESGRLDLKAIVRASGEASIYACGPPPMLDDLIEICREFDRPAPMIERFAATAQSSSTPDALDGAFHVEDVTSGERIEVLPGITILNALLDAGFDIPFSCTEGTCGTCEQVVVDGTPDHRDFVLSEDEQAANDAMMVCVSRSRSETLTLELPPKT